MAAGLSECATDIEDPIERFKAVFQQAKETETSDYTAVTLATVSADGQPSARVVLLKGVDHRGFSFFTNKRSRKAAEILANPRAALCFYWPSIGQQVRVEGKVVELSDAESDAYFASRSRGSQIGAWASNQSEEIPSRTELMKKFEKFQQEFEGREVLRPFHWGGYLVIPHKIEFWITGEFRLHDRFLFEREGDSWKMRRLSP